MEEVIYNKNGTGYNETRCADPEIAKQIVQSLGIDFGQVLDLGCGTRNYSIALEEKGLEVTGIDPSEKMLTVARQKSQSVRWKIGTAEKIPIEDEIFDGVFGNLTCLLYTSPSPRDRTRSRMPSSA